MSRARQDASVITALTAVVAEHGRWGFWKCFDRLRLQGHGWNHKRVHRVYCALRLNLPRRTKRRVPHRLRRPLVAPPVLNQAWAIDFMADALYDRRRFRYSRSSMKEIVRPWRLRWGRRFRPLA
jgi:putative transposase